MEGVFMDDVLINVVDEDEEYPAIARLVDLGRQKTYVTIDDILHFFPEAESDVEQLEEAFAALISAGIPYIEDEIIEEPAEDELEISATDEEAEQLSNSLSLDDLANIDTDDTIGLYLKEVSRVPLLNAEEEVDLAQRIERGRMAREELARGNVNARRRHELRHLIEDGWAAREHLITANSRLVISVAKKYMGRGVPFLDLIQEGNIGLIRATKKFDYRRGHKFSTTPPGGFARQSRGQLLTRDAQSACRCIWVTRSTSCFVFNTSLHSGWDGNPVLKNWLRPWMYHQRK
jgi:RNA polymerase primary sigma factor